jgi:septal ring factor EnvC (AmiA/AmiB activator)
VAQKVGDTVEQGELVGLVGDTGSLKGAYLYFELRANGKPVDPMPWFHR